jgi:hypothetical protein
MTKMIASKILAGIALFAFPASASAQMWNNQPNAIRVQVNVTIQQPAGASQGIDDQSKAMEAARRAIYESVKAECGNLSAAFDSDCRLVSINANSSIMERGNMAPMINTNANAGFELTTRAPRETK